jgi:hypothetical protein
LRNKTHHTRSINTVRTNTGNNRHLQIRGDPCVENCAEASTPLTIMQLVHIGKLNRQFRSHNRSREVVAAKRPT